MGVIYKDVDDNYIIRFNVRISNELGLPFDETRVYLLKLHNLHYRACMCDNYKDNTEYKVELGISYTDNYNISHKIKTKHGKLKDILRDGLIITFRLLSPNEKRLGGFEFTMEDEGMIKDIKWGSGKRLKE